MALVIFACTSRQRAEDSAPTDSARVRASRSTSCGDRLLTEEGIGPLRIGITVDSIRAACRVLTDTVMTDMEGMPSRRLAVAVAEDSVEAEIVNGKLWRISIASPRFQTSDSLGVGTPIARFKAMSGAHTMMGEGSVFVATPSHCGMSFQLTGFKPVLGRVVLANLPPSVTVLGVLIFGCHPPTTNPG